MLLVVAATDREVTPLRTRLTSSTPHAVAGCEVVDGLLDGAPVRLAVTGLARANTAFHLGRLLLAEPPAAVLQVGVGGTFDPDRAPLGTVALATTDAYGDVGVRTDDGWLTTEDLGFALTPEAAAGRFACDVGATEAVAGRLGAPRGPFVTVETVTGTDRAAAELRARHDPLVESMEGAAAAHACTLAGVAFVELRGVSNVVGARERGAWRLDDAIEAVTRAALRAAPTVLDDVGTGAPR